MKVEVRKVTVEVNGKTFEREYNASVAESAADLLALLSSTDEKVVKKVIGDWNYGSDLKAKSVVRAEIMKVAAGPDKAIEKAIKSLMDMRATIGKPITEEQAKTMLGLDAPPAA